jgi:hypothetical protein
VPGHGIKAPVLAFMTDLHCGSACNLASSLSTVQALRRAKVKEKKATRKERILFMQIILG